MCNLKTNFQAKPILGAIVASSTLFLIQPSAPVHAQFTCNDVSLGQDQREIQTPDGIKRGSAVITGLNCDNANHYQYQNNYDQRVLERNQSRDQQVTDAMRSMGNNQSEIMWQYSQTQNQMIQNLFGGNNTLPIPNNPRRCGIYGANNSGDC